MGTRCRSGFTMVEVMVVVTIIMILMLVAIPSVAALIQTSAATQADNMVRATLGSARAYAVGNGVVAGIRFQDDGHMVLVRGALESGDNFATGFVDKNTGYVLKAVEGYEPSQLPDPWRATCGSDKATADFAAGDYVMFPVVLFHSTGRVMSLKQCYFPGDWYGSYAEGSFGKVVNVNYTQSDVAAVSNAPALSIGPSLFNQQQWNMGADKDKKLEAIKNTAIDFRLDYNTGSVVRSRVYQKIGRNFTKS